MISNYTTGSKKRVDSDKAISVEERNRLVELAEQKLSESEESYRWNANIGGIIVRLKSNSFHLYDFWQDNWYAAPRSSDILPHGIIYAVTGVEGEQPHAYYNSETKTAIFINTEYYGQCKSWALGIAADIMEVQHRIHSIHGACCIVDGKGVVVIAPTGTGKSTHTYGLIEHFNGQVHSDDWIFVKYKKNMAIAHLSERKFYMRTDIVENYPRLKAMFDKSKCENVEDNDYLKFGNSRVILDPLWIKGPENFVEVAIVKAVILLRRDETSPSELKLSKNEAIDILKEGKYRVLAGAGDNIGEFGYEPFYNPYLLVRREGMQVNFFSMLFDSAKCYILNTGVENVRESQERIIRIVSEV